MKQSGGKRAGAGRHQEYGEATTTVAFRIPISRKAEIKKLIADQLNNWKIKN